MFADAHISSLGYLWWNLDITKGLARFVRYKRFVISRSFCHIFYYQKGKKRSYVETRTSLHRGSLNRQWNLDIM